MRRHQALAAPASRPAASASRSTTTTVAPAMSSSVSSSASAPVTTRRSIWSLAPKVVRADCSNAVGGEHDDLGLARDCFDRPILHDVLAISARSRIACWRRLVGAYSVSLTAPWRPFACVTCRLAPCRRDGAGAGACAACCDAECRARGLIGGIDVVVAIAFDAPLHRSPLNAMLLLAAYARPRIDHLRDPVGGDRVAGAERRSSRAGRSRCPSSRRAAAPTAPATGDQVCQCGLDRHRDIATLPSAGRGCGRSA